MPDAVLDPTAEALARRALAALPADAPHGRADIARLPAPIARLLASRLDAAVRQAAPASPWVDASDDRVREATAAWLEAARAAAQFPPDAWADAVRQASSRALAHLVRPAATLADDAFTDAQTLPVDTAIERTRVFGPYPYLPEIAARYAQRKEVQHLDRIEFEHLLERIDRRMVQPFSADDWVTLLAPLFDLVGPAASPPSTVPTAVLRAFFDAKGAGSLADALAPTGSVTIDDLRRQLAEALGDADGAASVPPPPPAAERTAPPVEDEATPLDETAPLEEAPSEEAAPAVEHDDSAPIIGSRYQPPELERTDDSDILGPPRPVPAADSQDHAAPPVPEPLPPSPLPAEDEAPPASADGLQEDRQAPVAEPASPARSAPPLDAAPDADQDEPLWMRLARERDAAPASAPAPAAPSDDVPLWKRFAQSEIADRLPPPDVGDIVPEEVEAVLDEDDSAPAPVDDEAVGTLEARVLGSEASSKRSWFVTELFRGNTSDYRDTLSMLDASPTYTEATTIVSTEVLRKHGVSPYTEAAVAFIDAIQAQYERR